MSKCTSRYIILAVQYIHYQNAREYNILSEREHACLCYQLMREHDVAIYDALLTGKRITRGNNTYR